MGFFIKEVNLETKSNFGFYDITNNIEKILCDSGFSNGSLVVQSLHTTVGIFVNEAEERLANDFKIYLSRKVPQVKGWYLHDDIDKRNCSPDEPLNAHSHLKSVFYSNPSVALIFLDSKLALGKYQRIFFAEFDGPCPRKHKDSRKYLVGVFGE